MKSFFRTLKIAAAFSIILGTGVLLGRYLVAKNQSPVIYNVVQQIRDVSKLTTSETTFSYIYPYKDCLGWDVELLRKKALVVVNGTVSYGYDLNETMTIDSVGKILYLKQPPTKILSIDVVPEIHDITPNILLSLSVDDYNKIIGLVRKDIEEKASALHRIECIKNNHINMIKLIAENAGWKVLE